MKEKRYFSARKYFKDKIIAPFHHEWALYCHGVEVKNKMMIGANGIDYLSSIDDSWEQKTKPTPLSDKEIEKYQKLMNAWSKKGELPFQNDDMFIIKYRKLYIKKLDSIAYEFALGEKHEATRFKTEREASDFIQEQQLWNTIIERVRK